jgi:hypothetical protein
MDLAELVIYDRLLTGAESSLVGGYLGAKYGITYGAELPEVTLSATDADADEWDLDPGRFTVTRDNSSGELTVHYSIGGTASAADYSETLTGSVVIADGQTSATINITPVHDVNMVVEGDETVILTVTADAAYAIGTPSAGTVTIEDVLPGDANGNDVVNDADLSLLLTSWPGAGPFTWQQGDFTGDTVVNDSDLSWLLAFWEDTYPPPAGTAGPEAAGGGDAPADTPAADTSAAEPAGQPAPMAPGEVVSSASASATVDPSATAEFTAESVAARRRRGVLSSVDSLRSKALDKSNVAGQDSPGGRIVRPLRRRAAGLSERIDVDVLRDVRPQVLRMEL